MEKLFIGYDPGGVEVVVLFRPRADGGIEVVDEYCVPPEPKQERIVPPLLPAPSAT